MYNKKVAPFSAQLNLRVSPRFFNDLACEAHKLDWSVPQLCRHILCNWLLDVEAGRVDLFSFLSD